MTISEMEKFTKKKHIKLLPPTQINIANVNAIRAQVNVPVISTNKLIWQMGVNYWSSKFNVTNPTVNDFATALDKTALLTAGINTTVFKPLNEKNFLIFPKN